MYYSEYVKNSMNPCAYSTFRERVKRGKTLEQMIILDYYRKYRYSKVPYSKYCDWCFDRNFVPKSKEQYTENPHKIYEMNHSHINMLIFSSYDKDYIFSQHLHHTERKGDINQYFVLWWKLFFKRKYRV